MNIKKFIILILVLALPVSLVSCNGGGKNEIGTTNGNVNDNTDAEDTVESSENITTESVPTITPEEIVEAENVAYLQTVDYLNFELTHSDAPYFVGRWFEKEINGESHMVTVTSGSALYFLVNNATSFDVNFTVITTMEEPYFAYSIDGGEPIRQHITDPTVTLPDTNRHTVRIIADGMTEGEGKWIEEKGFALKSVTASEGGEIFGIKPRNKVIFYYGDSITEGVRALNMNATSDGNSATNSYAWYCSDELGAVTYSIGYGATGVVSDGSFNTFIKAIDYYSENREVDDGIIPDLIVINHGANDGRESPVVFKSELTKAIQRLQEKYPGVTIVYPVPFGQGSYGNIRAVLKDFENVHLLETARWGLSYTDGLHPDVAGAKKAGTLLAEALRDIMGEDFFE